MLLLLQSYCPSSPSCHVATPLPARYTLSPSPPSHMATWPPPSPHTPHCHVPRMHPVVAHLTAAWPRHHPLAAAHTTSLLPAHVAPLAAAHTTSPHALQHGYITASLTVAHITSPCASLLHRPCRPPHSCTCHIAAHLVIARTTSPPSQLHMLHRCAPDSHMGHVAVHLVAAHHIAAPLAVLAPGPTSYCL